MGGKGGGGSAAPAEQAPVPVSNSNPGLDMFLAEQAANNQAAMQQQQLNAQLMQAPQQNVDPGLRPAQQQEQDMEGGYDPNGQLLALISALRGET